MRRIAIAAAGLVLTGLMMPLSAQEALPPARIVLQDGFDMPGGDLGPIFEIGETACVEACLSNSECSALTYNASSRACFPKANPDPAIPFEGALSGLVYKTDPEIEARAAEKLANVGSWLSEADLKAARRQAETLSQTYPGSELSIAEIKQIMPGIQSSDREEGLRLQAAIVARTDDPAEWETLSLRFFHAADSTAVNSREMYTAALAAATNAWLRDSSHIGGLTAWAQAAAKLDRGKDALAAMRSGLPASEEFTSYVEEYEARFSFRVEDNNLLADGVEPRFCVSFSEKIDGNADLRPYVDLPDPTMGVEANGSELCITGMARGTDLAITLRKGLPAASGEVLDRDTRLTTYIADRSPSVRFPGRAYVLPASGDLGLTIHTVNTPEAELSLYRMSDRNLIAALRDQMFGTPLEGWQENYFTDTLGEKLWQGAATIAPPAGGGSHPVNAEVASRLDLRGEAGPLEPGIYVLRAAIPDADEDISPTASQWFMVSDLGLSSFSGTDGLTVAVLGLSDARPREGIEVALVSRGNAVLGTARTDAQGIAHFDAGLTRGRGSAEPGLITASRPGDDGKVVDLSFLSLMDPEFDLSDRGVEGNPPAPPIDLFAALDRGAYRAGETAHATILARDSKVSAIDGLPLSATIIRPDGAEYTKLMPAPAGDGGFVLDFPIPATAPRGAWRIDLRVEEDSPALASMRMLVEDFRPERIDFDLDLGSAPLAADADIATAIDARWLYGAPAADLPVEGELSLRPVRSLPGWEGYVFGREDDTRTTTASMISGRTGPDGSYRVETRIPPEMANSTRPVQAEMRLSVLEGAGRPVERRSEVLVRPARALPGIKPDFDDNTVPEGTEAQFSVIALGPDLTAQPGQISWHLNRIHTEYQWYSIDGDWNWEPIISRRQIASGELALDGSEPASLSAPVDWGEYELIVKTADGAEASSRFYAGWGVASSAKDTPDRLKVTLDKPAYRAGETAIVSFEAPADGAALVSVMSNHLVTLASVSVSEGMNTIRLPVTDEWGAGVYVAVNAIRPLGEDAGHTPVRTLGLAAAGVDPGSRLLDVALEAPEQIDPRGNAELTLAVTGAAPDETVHATIAAVDQGILNITGYQPPSASDHYFGQRRLGVGLRDLYGRLILSSGAADGAIRSGGDAPGASDTAPPPTEKLMAWFSGPVTLDENGKAQISVPLPDFNGEVRLMAVAWTAGAVGQADKTMLVRDPVVMTVTAPAFLSPEDTARLRLSLTHVSGPAGKVALSIAPLAKGQPGQVAIAASGLSPEVTLAEGQRLPLDVTLNAPGAEGQSGLRISAVLPDGRTITKDLQIPVLRQDMPVTRAMRLSIRPGDNVTPDLSGLGPFFPGSGRVTLSAGAYGLLDIPAALTLLRDFPYGCTEQLTSKAMPQLYVSGLMDTDMPALPGNFDEGIDSAIAKILTRQTPSGGFGLWNARNSEPWLDAYATDFLSRARAQGHALPETSYRRALSNLQNRLNAASDPQYASDGETAAMAYAAYVLAREGSAVVSDLRYYVDAGAGSFKTPLAAAQLGAALSFLGDQPRADRMFERANMLLAEGADPSGLRRDFGTLLRDRAAVIALAAEAGTGRIDRDRLAGEISVELARRGGNGGLSSQEAMWTVLAGHALSTGDDPGQGLTFGDAPLAAPVLDLGDAAAPLALPLGNRSDRAVDVTLSATAVPVEPITADGTHYRIERRYYTPEGAPVDPGTVPQGQRMVVVLNVTPFGDYSGRLIMADPLPAGFEIDNPNLISSGKTEGLDWYGGSADTDMTEFRANRFAASLENSDGDSFQLAYRVRAVTPGSFHHPAATVSDFYRPERRGWTDSGTVTVTP